MQAATRDRIAWASFALGCAAVLVTSRMLTPSATGVGTHTQLGLPPCGFLLLFHVPCPACGLTTAFAHLAHGSLRASLAAHPLGAPLFVALVLLALRALYEALRSQPRPGFSVSALQVKGAALYAAALTVVWLVRLAR